MLISEADFQTDCQYCFVVAALYRLVEVLLDAYLEGEDHLDACLVEEDHRVHLARLDVHRLAFHLEEVHLDVADSLDWHQVALYLY